jgi:hypothetical protein
MIARMIARYFPVVCDRQDKADDERGDDNCDLGVIRIIPKRPIAQSENASASKASHFSASSQNCSV